MLAAPKKAGVLQDYEPEPIEVHLVHRYRRSWPSTCSVSRNSPYLLRKSLAANLAELCAQPPHSRAIIHA